MPPVWPEYHPLDRLPPTGILAAVSFGEMVRATDALTVRVPMSPLGEPVAEVWRVNGAVTRGRHGEVEVAHTGEVLFGTVRAGRGPAEAVADAVYTSLVETVRAADYPHLWRIWNHVGGINEEEDGLERYKRFSAGRHEALTRLGWARERFPAASAVGMGEPGLLVYFLAGRTEGRQVENPRQVSAYEYPPQYGPRSPSFSRASVVGDDLIFVSGTASVVGHESRHGGSPSRQLEETIDNLDVTIGAAAAVTGRRASVQDLTTVKIYLRGAGDHEEIGARLREVFPRAMVVCADICRAELLLEIEGVVVLPSR